MSDIIIGREYGDKIIEFVKNAKKCVKILIYDWRWYPNESGTKIQRFNYEILQAKRRGVAILAVVNSDRLCARLVSENVSIKKCNLKNTMHAKMVIIDEKYLILGSHNLTKNAFELNHEISVVISDSAAIQRCSNFFDNIYNQ